MTSEKVRIGKIVGCHGVRGDVKVRTASDSESWSKAIREVLLKDPKTGDERLLKIQSARLQGPMVVLHFEGTEDRNQAELLVGAVLYTNLTSLPKPQEDEYWVDDLIGLTVVDAQTGRTRGTIKDLLSSGGSDFLEIQLEDSDQTVVIPFIDQFFPKVDIEQRTVSVDLLSDFLAADTKPVTADRLQQ